MALSLPHFSPSWFPNSSKQAYYSKNCFVQIQPKPSFKFAPSITTIAGNHRRIIPKATQESTNKSGSSTSSEAENQTAANETGNGEKVVKSEEDGGGGGDDASKLGAEIQKAIKERAEKGGGGEEEGLVSGVLEEVREIEWPAFDKVLGTTGVVLSVIAGSSVVLLTVNAVLAELSDRVFAGKGVQDFFG